MKLPLFCQEMALHPKGGTLFFVHALLLTGIDFPESTMAILHTPPYITSCCSHTVIMAGTVIYITALHLA
jgi:hypothetical protein